MESFSHNLTTLFQQLGLGSDSQSISRLISEHPLNNRTALADASFWNNSQSDFIRESISQDADWAEAVDELDALLRR